MKFEDFEVISDGEKADMLLNELAYRLYLKTKGASADQLAKLSRSIFNVCAELERKENQDDVGELTY